MKTAWTKGLDDQDEKDIRGNFKEALVLRKRLSVIAEEKITTSHNHCLNKKSYDTPNWAYLQADSVGYERALKEIIALLQETM